MPAAVEKLKIQKYTVDVEVRTSGGEERKVSVFVAEGMTVDGRTERLSDIFDTRRFVPTRWNDQFQLLNTGHVVWLRLGLIEAIDELDPQAEHSIGATAASVRIELDDGTIVQGGLRYYLPSTTRRVADYLQTAPRWIPVRTPDLLYLVNRDRIVRVVPVEG